MFDRRALMRLIALCFVLTLHSTTTPVLASCNGAPPLLKDLLKAATQATDFYSEMPAGYGRTAKQIGDPLNAARLAAISAKGLCSCAGSSSPASCLQGQVDKQFLCDLYEVSGLPDFTNPFSVMSVFFPPVGVPLAVAYEVYYGDEANPFCAQGDGDTVLYCCDLTHGQGCGSYIGPQQCTNYGNGQIVGTAAPHPQTGTAWCGHIAECALDGSADSRGASRSERLGAWAQNLANAYADAAYGGTSSGGRPSACTADFGMMVGCRGFFELLRGAQPFMSLETSSHAFRHQEMATAAQRVMYALPNGLDRFEHVMSLAWTPQSKRAYLRGVDAEGALLKWLSPCGLELLEATLPNRWQLLAVPHPGETAPVPARNADEWVDGCLEGRAPSEFSATVTRQGQDVTVEVHVGDPEAAQAGGDVMPLSVDWGDGTVTGEVFRHGRSNTYSHTYAQTIPASLTLGYINGAGYSLLQTADID